MNDRRYVLMGFLMLGNYLEVYIMQKAFYNYTFEPMARLSYVFIRAFLDLFFFIFVFSVQLTVYR